MKFGTKAGEAPRQSSAGGGKFIKYFRKGETRVRFLEEMDDWTKIYEHFNQTKSRSYPCTGDQNTCPGCTSSNERERTASVRFVTNALTPDNGYVDLWKVPVSIHDDLARYADKDGGTIRARDYTVVQFKDDTDRVKYSVDREEKDRIDLDPYQAKLQDHQQALADAYIEAWGSLPDQAHPAEVSQDVTDHRAQMKAANTRRLRSVNEDEVAKKPAPAKGDLDEATGKPLREQTPEHLQDPPSEPAAPEVEGEQGQDETEVELDEKDLRAMSAEQIKGLFRQCQLPVPDTDDTTVLADELITALNATA